MRQKRVKQATKELLASEGVIVDIEKIKPEHKRVSLEIGSGKGKFITSLAVDHPDELFIAMEININVCYRILEKRNELNLKNLVIILGDATHLIDYFDPHTVDHIYLNFSDPWPKKKHHKRRLTAPSFLNDYTRILKHDGLLQFRTDHIDLFNDSIETIHSYFEILSVETNLAESNYMTEYEVKKRQEGPIFQLIGKVNQHA
ncbi:MAG: tRNA (guanosine(46)-N7)-methyltransferase TrmB [Bacillota bacterium]|nr:MAG: tRNA (guanosine(46)-N7)-methyltransferase TrmB [Bacillota bacterium]